MTTVHIACGVEEATPDGSGGKADTVSDGELCFRGYALWLLTEVKEVMVRHPFTEGDATRFRVVAADDAVCRDWEGMADSPAFTTWQDLVVLVVATPYLESYGKAFDSFHLGESHSTFIEKVRLDPELRTKLGLLAQIRPAVTDGLGFRMWLDAYWSFVTQLTLPLERVAGTGAFDEGYFTLNESEAEFLTLVEATRPRVIGDGGYAAWVEEFRSIIYDGTQLHQDDDFSHFERSSPARDRLIERYETLRPRPVGPQDQAAWMWLFSLAASTARVDNPQEMAQLALVERVGPESPRGDEAYKPWLDAYETVLTNEVLRDRHVLPVKPCAAGAASRELHATFRAAHASTPEALLAAADPARCD